MTWTVCNNPDCPELTRSAYCDTHKPKAWASSTRRARLPHNWDKTRHRILRRDPTCRICHVAPSTEVDHITNGDNHADHNLQGVCKPCHAAKTQAEAAQGRKASA